jgi:WD40 repeat protein
MGTTTPLAKLSLPQYSEQVSVAYDGTGLVFGVCCIDGKSKKRSIKLFDARNYQQGPFEDLSPSVERMIAALQGQPTQAAASPSQPTHSQAMRILQSSWHGFEFSPDGFHLLVNSSEALIVLDGFKKDAPLVVIPRKGEYSSPLGACFSADAKYALCGTDDNDIHIYDKLTGTLKNSLTGGHVAPVGCIRCNPRYDIIASGCVNTALWVRTSKQ